MVSWSYELVQKFAITDAITKSVQPYVTYPTYTHMLLLLLMLLYTQVYSDMIHVFYNWGRETHICVSKLTTIGSDNGLSPGRRQAIMWTNAGI